jgi:hypothetical protein
MEGREGGALERELSTFCLVFFSGIKILQQLLLHLYSCDACMHSPIQSRNGGQQLLQIARAAVGTYFNLEVKKTNESDIIKNNSRLLITAIHCPANYKLILTTSVLLSTCRYIFLAIERPFGRALAPEPIFASV